MMYPWQEQFLQQFQNDNQPQTRVSPSDPRARVNPSDPRTRVSPPVFSSSVPGDVRMRNPLMMHNLLQEMRNIYQSGMVGPTSIAQHGLQNRAPPPLYNSMTRTNTGPQLRGPPPLLNVSTLRQPPPAHSNKRQPPPPHSNIRQPPPHSNQPSYMVHHNINQIRPNIPRRHTSGETIRLTNPFENEINVPCTRTSPHLSPDMFISQAGNTQMSTQSISSTQPNYSTLQSNVTNNNVSQRLQQSNIDPRLGSQQSNIDPRLVSQQSNIDPRLVSQQSNNIDPRLVSQQSNIDPRLVSEQSNIDPRLVSQQSNIDPRLFHPSLYLPHLFPPLGFIPPNLPENNLVPNMMPRMPPNPFTEFNIPRPQFTNNQDPPVINQTEPTEASDKSVMGRWYKLPISDLGSEKKDLIEEEKERIHRPSKPISHSSLENVVNKLARRRETVSPISSVASQFPVSREEPICGPSTGNVLLCPATPQNQHQGQSLDTIRHEGHSIDTIRPEGESVDILTHEGQTVDTIRHEGHSIDTIQPEGQSVDTVKQQHICSDLSAYQNSKTEEGTNSNSIQNNKEEIFDDIGLYIVNTYSLAGNDVSIKTENNQENTESSEQNQPTRKKIPPLKIKLPFRKSPKKKRFGNSKKSKFVSPIKLVLNKNNKKQIEIRKPKALMFDQANSSEINDSSSTTKAIEDKNQLEIRKPKALMFDQSNSSERKASSSTTNAIEENGGDDSISATLNQSDTSGKSLGDVVEKVKQKRQRRRSAVLIDQTGKVLSSEENLPVKTTEKTETVIENNKQEKKELKNTENVIENKKQEKKDSENTENVIENRKQEKKESENTENVISGSENIDEPMLPSSENIVSSEQNAPSLKEQKNSDSLSREERNRELIEKNWVHIEAKLKLVEKNLKNKSPQKKQPLPLETKAVEKTSSLKRKSDEMKSDNSNNEPFCKKKSPLKEKLFKSPLKKTKSPKITKTPNNNTKEVQAPQSSQTCSSVSSKSKSEERSLTPKSGKGKRGGKSKNETPEKDDNSSVDISGNPSKRRKLSGTVEKHVSETKLSSTSASSRSVGERSTGDVIVVGEDKTTDISNEQTKDTTELISSITYPSFFITFHGKRVLCLNSSSGKLLLMREILRRNFKEVVNKKSQNDNDMQKQYKTVYLAKERDLKICYKEIPEEHKNLAVKYLKAEKLIKTQKIPAHLGVITLENALRLYHYMNGTKTCSMKCLEMWSPKESDIILENTDKESPDRRSVPNNPKKSEEVKSKSKKNKSGYDSDETMIYEDESAPPSQNQNEDEENNDNSRLVLRGGVAECYQAYFRYIVVEGEKFYPYEDLLLKFGKIALTRALQSKLPEKFLAYKCSEVEADFLNKLEEVLPTLSIEATLLEESLFQKVASTVESSSIHGEVVDLTAEDMSNESKTDIDDINISQDDSIIEISFNSPESPLQCEETKHVSCNSISANIDSNSEPTNNGIPTEIPQLYPSPPTDNTCNEISGNIDSNVEPTNNDIPTETPQPDTSLPIRDTCLQSTDTTSTEIPQTDQSPLIEDTCLQRTDTTLNMLNQSEKIVERAVCDSTTDLSNTTEENNNDGNSPSVMIGNTDLAAMLAELESEFGSSSDNDRATDISAGSALEFMTESFGNSRNMMETLLNIWKHGVCSSYTKISALQAEMKDLKAGTNKVLSTCEKYQGLINKIKENIEGKKENEADDKV
ncbi:uncharacterized protein LOC143071726 isoform X1 [Mytilus galloprovincialis]|uniref:uncharacterized protein LOC143071726 isoform X1 n=1 Tax=Mytilus galloprovincialis TaxID=29158 RepID=UPI003F7BDDCA